MIVSSMSMSTDIVVKLRKDFRKDLAKSIHSKTKQRIRPSAQVMNSFYKFVARSFKYALKDQLLHTDGRGYASGSLFESIEVKAGAPNGGDWSRGIKWVDTNFTVSMNRGGKHIAKGTTDLPSIGRLLQWIEEKQASGTLMAAVYDQESKEEFAVNIYGFHKENGLAATYPNWYEIDQNPLLMRDFHRYFNSGKSYHIGRITDSIKSKIQAK